MTASYAFVASKSVMLLIMLVTPPDRLVDEEIKCTGLEYDRSEAVVRPQGPPKKSDSLTSVNDLEDGPPQPDTLNISYTVTTSTGWKHSAGLKIGAKMEFQAGIPTVVNTKAEISTEVSYDF
jgi:hypothetical protein